jgi:branched-chain amino acid transport system permease protein
VNDHYKKLGTLLALILPFALIGKVGYAQWVIGYVYLFLIQGYVAWFLFFRTNQPFFGYSVTMALGAYSTAILTGIYEWPLVLGILAGGVIASAVAMLLFLSTSRARGFYLSMISFLLAIMFPMLIDALRPITGGRNGIYFRGLRDMWSRGGLFALIVGSTVLAVAFLFWLMSTKTGKTFTLIAENDDLAQAVGINTFKYKLLAYGIAGLISGLGGALYVNYIGFISSIDVGVFTTTYITFIPIVGGSQLCYGPILGALIVFLLPDLLVPMERFMDIIFGGVFVAIILLIPGGIAPGLERLVKWAYKRLVRRRHDCIKPETQL